MHTQKFILAIDQGTTGSTAAILNSEGCIVGIAEQDFPQIFPKPGWVEHSPADILSSVISSIEQVVAKTGINPHSIVSIGITNQRETVLAWDSQTGRPIYNAIVWQCRRTSEVCEALKKSGLSRLIRKKTGLVIDPYFSGTKIAWILQNVKEAKKLLGSGRLRVGTIDTFLLWQLTGGESFKTETSNASRTLLMNLKSLDWDETLLKIFRIPRSILPDINDSAHFFGVTKNFGVLPDGIPISGILGDQQAALFGQACFSPGTVKCTYGTGSFILLNTGSKIVQSKHGMLTTVAWKIKGKTTYAIEGGAFICGAAVQWLRDGLKFINSSSEIEELAMQVESAGGVEFVPALTGLGAPYWEPNARGAILGLTRGTTSSHIARATLEAMALQNVDILVALEKDLGRKIRSLNVDGGASANNLLLHMQADYLGVRVIRPKIIETTALGAGLIAGLGFGLWQSTKDLLSLWKKDIEFFPKVSSKARKKRIAVWHQAIKKTIM